jgi:EmrB/QacA subfamily drug resistance transporter
VAIPYLDNEFSLSTVEGLWVLNAYLLALLAFFIISGKLSDLFGKRFIFLMGFSIFGVSSVFAALSFAGWWLILSRVFQGIGAALNFSSNSAILLDHFPLRDRPKAIGLNTGISSVFLMGGPAVGGYLTQYLNWRYIFWLNLPFVLYGVILASIILPADVKKGGRLHITGSIFAILAMTVLVFGLMQGGVWGWLSPGIISCYLGFLIFTFLFIKVNKRARHPLLDFSYFNNASFNMINICIFLMYLILTFFIFLAIYLQKQLDFTPSQAGLILFIGSIPAFFAAPAGGYLSSHFSHKLPMIGGFIFLVIAFVWFLIFPLGKHYVYFLAPLIIYSVGISIIRPPALAFSTHKVSSEHMGIVIGMIKTNRQFAATLGLAIMTAIYHGSYKVHHSYQEAFSISLWLYLVSSIICLLILIFFLHEKKQA